MKNKSNILGGARSAAVFMLLATGAGFAMAANAGNMAGVASGITGQMPELAKLLSSFSYLLGIGFGIKGVLKLKESNEKQGQVPISTPIILILASGLLLALPTLITTARGTVFGAGAESTGIEGGSAIQGMGGQ